MSDQGEILYQTESVTVRLLPNRCVANAACAAAAPGYYVLDQETGYLTLENGDIVTIPQLFAGARACPTQAIVIEQYGRRVFPQILTPMWGEGRGERSEE
ncbi:MAG: hypothetical protein QM753_09020 [Thermomicrobiales bacterium]